MEEVSVYTISQKGIVLQYQNNRMLALIPHTSKVQLYITVDRIQKYLSREISDIQAASDIDEEHTVILLV